MDNEILRVRRFEFCYHFDFVIFDHLYYEDFVDLFPADHASGFVFKIIHGANIAHASMAAGIHDYVTFVLVTNFAQFFFRAEGFWQDPLAGSCFFLEIVSCHWFKIQKPSKEPLAVAVVRSKRSLQAVS